MKWKSSKYVLLVILLQNATGVILNHSTGQALDPDDLPEAWFEARQPHLAPRHPVAGGPPLL